MSKEKEFATLSSLIDNSLNYHSYDEITMTKYHKAAYLYKEAVRSEKDYDVFAFERHMKSFNNSMIIHRPWSNELLYDLIIKSNRVFHTYLILTNEDDYSNLHTKVRVSNKTIIISINGTTYHEYMKNESELEKIVEEVAFKHYKERELI